MKKQRSIFRVIWRCLLALPCAFFLLLWICGFFRVDHVQTGTMRPQLALSNYQGRMELFCVWYPKWVNPGWGEAQWWQPDPREGGPWPWKLGDHEFHLMIDGVDSGHEFLGILIRRGMRDSSGSETPRADSPWGSILFPQWMGALVAALPLVLPWAWRRVRRRRATGPRLCESCGYDLRAHNAGDKCPECGTTVIAALAAK